MSKRFTTMAGIFAALLAAAPAVVSPQDAPAEPDKPLLAGTDVPAPKRKKLILPEYPEEARSQGVRGIVLIEVVIEKDGTVGETNVLRSIPLLDAAALTAVKQWEYELSKVDDQPVRVRLTVPITFSLKIPDVTRQQGVPELRSGATPSLPPGEKAKGRATVLADVTLDADGKVSEAVVTKGESPWAEALLRALRTWVFQADSSRTIVSFKLEANFLRDNDDVVPRVDIHLTSPRVSEAVEPTTVPASAVPAPALPAAADEDKGTPVAGATPAPASAPAPPIEVIRAPPPSPPPPAAATTGPAPAAAAATPVAAATPEPPPVPKTPGISSIRDVALGPGVPDLTTGRRPVVPPSARIGQVTGMVTVEFSVNNAGATLVAKVEGPETFKDAAGQMVGSWQFQRTSTERLFLTAKVDYGADAARALVTLVQ